MAQVIDVENRWLQNVVTFPPNGAFIVNSSIAPEGERRVNFEFENAVFRVNGRDFTLPPFGKG